MSRAPDPTKKLPATKMMADNKSRSVFPPWLLTFLFTAGLIVSCWGQRSDSLTLDRRKLNTLVIASAATYTATYAGLYQLWYKNSAQQDFRFFNDNREWKQVDKLGHFYSAFYFSFGTARALRGANVSPRRADLIGALTGFIAIAPIEIFDGFSSDYGASSGDLLADAAGSLFFLGQQSMWQEVRIYPKFSFHRTSLAERNPRLLGDAPLSEVFKDYNGQTYWLSFDMDKFIPFPKWLNVAIGYGAHDMVNARDHQNAEVGLSPYRQYYFALDLDLTSLRTRSKVLKTLVFLANAVKIPAPALEFSRRGTKFHALAF